MSHLPTLGSASRPKIPFPASVASKIDNRFLVHGKFMSAAAAASRSMRPLSPISILYQGPNVEVLCPKTGERLASWSFQDDRKHLKANSQLEVTCAAELSFPLPQYATSNDMDDASNNSCQAHQGVWRLVVIGLSNCMVAILDIKSSRLIRVVKMPHRITALAVAQHLSTVSSMEDDKARPLADELTLFRGIVAVGTQEGHLYLLDAALDATFLEESEKSPADIVFLPVSKKAMRPLSTSHINQLADQRLIGLRRGEHCCIAVNSDVFLDSKKIFQYVSNLSGETTYFPESSVVISAVQFVPHLRSLLVGFNFGSWQMWDLTKLQLEFSSTYQEEESTLPITHFAFAEPEHDPRKFFYIWTASGENDFDTLSEKYSSLSSKAIISLYALSFKTRDMNGGLSCYSGLSSCSLRFQHELSGDPGLSLDHGSAYRGSICHMAMTLDSGLEEGIHRNDEVILSVDDLSESEVSRLGITIFMWEVHLSSPHQSTSHFYLGLFDLNSWYQFQMPSAVELEPRMQCSYFSFCSMDELINSGDARPSDRQNSQVWDVWVDTSSVTRHSRASVSPSSTLVSVGSPQKPEQYFYPSALAFNIIVLLDSGFLHSTHLGLQKKVLLELQSNGKEALVNPNALFELCKIAGLLVSISRLDDADTSQSQMVEHAQKRSALLTVALEHNLLSLLTSCITFWSDGKYSEAGCTLQFILEWAWERVVDIKQFVDRATMPLFDMSCTELNDVTRRILLQRSQHLQHLSVIIGKAYGCIQQPQPTSQDENVSLKHQLTNLICAYLDVILWFLNAELLPEQSEASGLSLFPASHLAEVYTEKRSRMKNRIKSWMHKDELCQNMLSKMPLLLIDGLCQDLGQQLKANFERDGGSGVYPPPSLHSLLVSYLIHQGRSHCASDIVHKHRIVQYLLLDLASCLANNVGHNNNNAFIIDTLIKFPSAFGIPASMIKLTQAFWLVDHEDFEEALTVLLDPLVRLEDITVLQHRAILMALLVQDQPKLALRYSKFRQMPIIDVTDVQLQVSILLANGMTHEAFQFQRRRFLNCNLQQERILMLRYFFERADVAGKLNTILQLRLDSMEENVLVNFLHDRPESDTNSKEVLLFYFLQRSRYQEAIELNEELNRQNAPNATRKVIMDKYAHILPCRKPGIQPAKLKRHKISLPVEMTLGAAAASPIFSSNVTFQKLSTSNFCPEASSSVQAHESSPFRTRRNRRKWEFEMDNNDKEAEAVCTPVVKRSRRDDSNGASASTSRAIFADVLSVLSTPTIEKKPKAIVAGHQVSALGKISKLAETPQSILKIRRAESPINRSDLDDESWLFRPSQFALSRESTPGKSLRFHVPKKLPPPDIVTPDESMDVSRDEDDVVVLSDSEDIIEDAGHAGANERSMKPETDASSSLTERPKGTISGLEKQDLSFSSGSVGDVRPSTKPAHSKVLEQRVRITKMSQDEEKRIEVDVERLDCDLLQDMSVDLGQSSSENTSSSQPVPVQSKSISKKGSSSGKALQGSARRSYSMSGSDGTAIDVAVIERLGQKDRADEKVERRSPNLLALSAKTPAAAAGHYSIYGPDETCVDVSLIERIAHEDDEDKEDTRAQHPSLQTEHEAIKDTVLLVDDYTTYGQDRTCVDVSLIERIAHEDDDSEEDQRVQHQSLLAEQEDVKDTVPSGNDYSTYGPDKTCVDVSLIERIAHEDDDGEEDQRAQHRSLLAEQEDVKDTVPSVDDYSTYGPDKTCVDVSLIARIAHEDDGDDKEEEDQRAQNQSLQAEDRTAPECSYSKYESDKIEVDVHGSEQQLADEEDKRLTQPPHPKQRQVCDQGPVGEAKVMGEQEVDEDFVDQLVLEDDERVNEQAPVRWGTEPAYAIQQKQLGGEEMEANVVPITEQGHKIEGVERTTEVIKAWNNPAVTLTNPDHCANDHPNLATIILPEEKEVDGSKAPSKAKSSSRRLGGILRDRKSEERTASPERRITRRLSRDQADVEAPLGKDETEDEHEALESSLQKPAALRRSRRNSSQSSLLADVQSLPAKRTTRRSSSADLPVSQTMDLSQPESAVVVQKPPGLSQSRSGSIESQTVEGTENSPRLDESWKIEQDAGGEATPLKASTPRQRRAKREDHSISLQAIPEIVEREAASPPRSSSTHHHFLRSSASVSPQSKVDTTLSRRRTRSSSVVASDTELQPLPSKLTPVKGRPKTPVTAADQRPVRSTRKRLANATLTATESSLLRQTIPEAESEDEEAGHHRSTGLSTPLLSLADAPSKRRTRTSSASGHVDKEAAIYVQDDTQPKTSTPSQRQSGKARSTGALETGLCEPTSVDPIEAAAGTTTSSTTRESRRTLTRKLHSSSVQPLVIQDPISPFAPEEGPAPTAAPIRKRRYVSKKKPKSYKL